MPGMGLTHDLDNKRVNSDIINPFEEDSLDWLGLDSIPNQIANPFKEPQLGIPSPDPVTELTNILVNPDYLHFAAKILLNVEIPPYQAVILDMLWKRRLPLLIMTRGGAKSFTLANYILLRLILHPGCSVVIVGSGLRQARQVFDYMITRWENSPILRDIAGKSKTAGPKREVDRFQFEIGNSNCWAIPLGQGDKIRGLRANYIISDEYACLKKGTLVESQQGIIRIEDCKNQNEINLFTGDKQTPFEKPANFIITPKTDVYTITTRNGFSFGCSDKHQVLTTNGWKLGKDLSQDDYLIRENKYVFPESYVSQDGITVDENLAWLMGILISEGCVSRKHQITVHMTDEDCVDRVDKAWQIFDPNINTGKCINDPYIDPRGWKCKKGYISYICNMKARDNLEKLGLDRVTALFKKVPWSILRSPKNIVLKFLSGVFEGDGSCFNYEEKGKKLLGIAYYSSSKQLCQELQFLISKLDIYGSIQSRKSNLSENPQWMVRYNSIEAKKLFDLLNIKKWEGIDQGCFYSDDRYKGVVFDKSRNKWKAEIYYCGKNVYLGRFDSKEQAFKVVEINEAKFPLVFQVKLVEKSTEQEHLYDFYLPKTHSFYGNGFIQHNSIPSEIFNVVVQGFGVVSSDPIDKMKEAALIKKMTGMGVWTEELEALRKLRVGGNQIVRSGTASYAFNDFYKCFEKWRKIVYSKGDPNLLKEIMGDDPEIAKGFDWRDYAVLRVPYTHVPEGILDPGILAQAKATLTAGQFMMEFGATFLTDSDGFYKRSTIEAATTNKAIRLSSGELVQFSVLRQGNPDKKYVIGVDPAAEADNAAIVVLEIYPDHRRIVHCWTTNRKKFSKFKTFIESKGHIVEDDYYRYIAKQIRLIMRTFATEHIIMDKNGGGIAIAESLATKDSCSSNEWPIYEISDPKDPKPNDIKDGLHILELLSPNSDINSDANHGMLRDFQDKILMFPLFDNIELFKSIELYKINENEYDTYEELVEEIELLKKEITSIVVTQSANLGKDTFNTPLTVQAGIKGRMRKDRYSALLYANYYARNLEKNQPLRIDYKPVGGTRDTMSYKTIKNPDLMYTGPGIIACQNPGWAKMGSVSSVKHGKSQQDPLYYF